MHSLSPHSPLLTLSVKPKAEQTTNDLLARFHPIMKELGFGNFVKEESWLYSASKPGESIFRAADVAFAQIDGDALLINFEGESIFGLSSIDKLLNAIKAKYDSSIACETEIHGPDYKNATISSLLFTGLPILTGSLIGIFLLKQYADYNILDQPLNVVYIVIATIATKTRFWITQRKKNRPVLLSAFFLFLIPLAVFGAVALFGLAMTALNA